MSASPRQSWIRAAVVVGIVYAVIGITFAAPATHVRTWRMAAWVVSLIAYSAHIAYECFKLRTAPRSAALHVASAVALGAFGLAVWANAHALFIDSTRHHHTLLLVSLGVWPAITAVPAFLIAVGITVLLARTFRS